MSFNGYNPSQSTKCLGGRGGVWGVRYYLCGVIDAVAYQAQVTGVRYLHPKHRPAGEERNFLKNGERRVLGGSSRHWLGVRGPRPSATRRPGADHQPTTLWLRREEGMRERAGERESRCEL